MNSWRTQFAKWLVKLARRFNKDAGTVILEPGEYVIRGVSFGPGARIRGKRQ